jgi:peptidyl-prolyl cis-trans isomerase A (cyclophilin A)/peptidyl-prolyl cis-trans isomerase B (cyclophilin B)
MKRIAFVLVAALLSVPAMAANPTIEMKTTAGTVTIELYADKAPKTVDNFVKYVKDGFYNGTVFHRVINNFMIQGGGFDKSLQQKPTRAPVQNEANNGLKNDLGTIAMARTSNPHSATAQFFINVKNNDFLNFREPTTQGYGYAVFGKVVSGMDVVMNVAGTPTGAGGPFPSDVPQTMVVIESIKLLPAANAAKK